MIRTIVGSGPLKADSLIILDVFPKDGRSGYYGDLTRTVVRGKANEAQRALWSTVLDAQKFALQNIRAGDSGAALQKEVSEYLPRERLSRQKFETGVGSVSSTGWATESDWRFTSNPGSRKPTSKRARC